MSRNIGGLSKIRTHRKANIRSMPKAFRNDYLLDLYILSKEKARMEQEKLALDKRKRNLDANLKDMRKKIKRIERDAALKQISVEGDKIRSAKSLLKTIVLNY